MSEPTNPISADEARRQAREEEQFDSRRQDVLADSPAAGKFGLTRWLKDHPQAIGEYYHANNLTAARLLTGYLCHIRACARPDYDIIRDLFIDGIKDGVDGTDRDSLVRRLVQLWKWDDES